MILGLPPVQEKGVLDNGSNARRNPRLLLKDMLLPVSNGIITIFHKEHL